MADLAAVYHWQPSELDALELERLLSEHELAAERFPARER